MDARRLVHLATHPVYTLRRISYRAYELLHPEEPWIARGAVRFCDNRLRPDMRAVETGSGRSTAWFAKRVGRLTSIEHDRAWFERVQEKLRDRPNVDYRFVPLDHAADEPTRAVYDPLPRYVAVFSEFDDESLDLVVVDGHYRQACVRAALMKIKPGGILLLDNSNWLLQSEWGIPESWKLVHRSQNVVTVTSVWERPKGRQ